MITSDIPNAWLHLTGTFKAAELIELRETVDRLGVAHDDLVTVRELWKARFARKLSIEQMLTAAEQARAQLLRLAAQPIHYPAGALPSQVWLSLGEALGSIDTALRALREDTEAQILLAAEVEARRAKLRGKQP
jgi:hypothetical protein